MSNSAVTTVLRALRSAKAAPLSTNAVAALSQLPARYTQQQQPSRHFAARIPMLKDMRSGDVDWFPKRTPPPDPSFKPEHWSDFYERYGAEENVPDSEIPKFEFDPADFTIEELFELGYHVDFDPFYDEEEVLDRLESQKVEKKARAQRTLDKRGRSKATGRRKNSVAVVWMWPVKEEEEEVATMTVNGKPFSRYFPSDKVFDALEPLEKTGLLGQYHVRCTAQGGGVSGQTGSIRLGIARGLEMHDPELRPALKQEGFLRRDPRMVERKKTGLVKARKAPTWVKR